MVSAIIALVFGALSVVLPAVPVVLPVIGLALALNAMAKQLKKEKKQKAIIIMATLALVSNGFVSTMFVIGRFIG